MLERLVDGVDFGLQDVEDALGLPGIRKPGYASESKAAWNRDARARASAPSLIGFLVP